MQNSEGVRRPTVHLCVCVYVCVEVEQVEREERQSEMFGWVRSDANAHLKQ